jgi:hypothetical protein
MSGQSNQHRRGPSAQFGRSTTDLQIDENGRARIRSAAQSAVPTSAEVIDLTQSPPPPHPSAPANPTAAGPHLSALAPASAGAVTTPAPVAANHHNAPGPLPAADIEVMGGLGHVRRRRPGLSSSEPATTIPASGPPTITMPAEWPAPPTSTTPAPGPSFIAPSTAENDEGISRIIDNAFDALNVTLDAANNGTMPVLIANMYRMPGSDVTRDTRQRDQAPFGTVNPQQLSEPWVPAVGGYVDAGFGAGEITFSERESSTVDPGMSAQGQGQVTGVPHGSWGLHGPAAPAPAAIPAPAAAPTPARFEGSGQNQETDIVIDDSTGDDGHSSPTHYRGALPTLPLQLPPATLNTSQPINPLLSGSRPVHPATQSPQTSSQGAIGMDSTDDQVQARVNEIKRLINAELHAHVGILHAILAANPAWQNQSHDARSVQQQRLWLAQMQTFEREFRQRHNIDPAAMAASAHRFTNHALSRMRHLLETGMRAEGGLPQVLLPGPELRFRRTVLEAQLRTLRVWTWAWRERLPAGHPERAGHVGRGGAGGHQGTGGIGGAGGNFGPGEAGRDASAISGEEQGISAKEMQRIIEFGRFVEF